MENLKRGCLLTLVIALLMWFFVIPAVMSNYDASTRERVLRTVHEELPPHASMKQMDEFMQRHTYRYALNDDDVVATHEYGGFLPQTQMDKLLLDRQVRISLKFKKHSKRFDHAEVQVFYTFL